MDAVLILSVKLGWRLCDQAVCFCSHGHTERDINMICGCMDTVDMMEREGIGYDRWHASRTFRYNEYNREHIEDIDTMIDTIRWIDKT